MAKIVNVEWMQPTREFNCPCCSATVVNADGKPAKKPCSHFLFNFEESSGDFVDYSDTVEPILDDVTADVSGPIDQPLLAILSESAVIYQIETRDHAGGPIVRTDVLAFDPLAA